MLFNNVQVLVAYLANRPHVLVSTIVDLIHLVVDSVDSSVLNRD